MRRALAACAAGVLAVLALTGCGSSELSYFLISDNGQVLLVEWGPVRGGGASGTISYDDKAGTAPDEWVGLDNMPMTITFRGGPANGSVSNSPNRPEHVTIILGARHIFSRSKISGTLSGEKLRLDLRNAITGHWSAGALEAASLPQFNAAVGKLQNEVTNDNERAANQQAAQQQARRTDDGESALSRAVTALQTDVSILTQQVTTAGSDVTHADADLGTLMSDAAAGQGPYCDNAYTVDDDAHTVNDDGYTMSDDVGTAEADIADVNAGIAKVQANVTAVHNDGGIVPKDVGTTVSNAQSAVSGAVNAVNTDVGAVNGYLQSAYSDASSNAGRCGGPGQPSLVIGIPRG